MPQNLSKAAKINDSERKYQRMRETAGFLHAVSTFPVLPFLLFSQVRGARVHGARCAGAWECEAYGRCCATVGVRRRGLCTEAYGA